MSILKYKNTYFAEGLDRCSDQVSDIRVLDKDSWICDLYDNSGTHTQYPLKQNMKIQIQKVIYKIVFHQKEILYTYKLVIRVIASLRFPRRDL